MSLSMQTDIPPDTPIMVSPPPTILTFGRDAPPNMLVSSDSPMFGSMRSKSGTFSSATGASFDGKRQGRTAKGAQFTIKHGQRHHAYDPEKAPYAVSYDRTILELEALDLALVKHLREGSVSFVNYDSEDYDAHPQRVLDLGCGTGTWVVDAAREWPEAELVGFDLAAIQVPLQLLEPSLASRITWTHGNFLTTKLPFEDDEFDHVHIKSIARGVPENKWQTIFEEVNRVLCPGGVVELIEEDIIFPHLPHWFTSPLRARQRRTASVHYPDGSEGGAYPARSDTPARAPLEHALLESLHQSVYEHRFINMTPSSVLPSYFDTYFRRITQGPVLKFPMPPIPPPPPPPPDNIVLPAAGVLDIGLDLSDPIETRPSSSARPVSISFSSTRSTSTEESQTASVFTTRSDSSDSTRISSLHAPEASNGSSSKRTSELFGDDADTLRASNTPIPALEVLSRVGDDESSTSDEDWSGPSWEPKQLFSVDSTSSRRDSALIPKNLLSADKLYELSARSLAMHLHW
ncbi:hypothetical protein BD626DRAFT_196556 [Schizophyllum amplum]|uniref:Methyltransferase domain-containing protein n=1 Tax=Schizophyllum amplum TaxID=97359 RepID=A0A550CMR3_9AGAR|nr:hypothetical protein BD626DRAFT_196556 [Auriculariopsis ampla]